MHGNCEVNGEVLTPMKLLLCLVLTALLSACAGPHIPHLVYLRKAEIAITEQKWEVAYRFLEDGLISPVPEAKERASALYRAHPQIRQAAAQSFSPASLKKVFDENGGINATSIERDRLRMYAVVATDEEIAVAVENYQFLVDNFDAARKAEKDRLDAAKQAEKERLNALEQSEKARLDAARQAEKESSEAAAKALAELLIKLEESRAAAFFKCKDKVQCDKAFALTQIFIASHSDMKIQMANDTIIETYNPNKNMAMGASAFKIPREGASAEIRLSVSCKSGVAKELLYDCSQESIRIHRAFPRYIRDQLLN